MPPLDHLHTQYVHSTALSAEVRLFWTLILSEGHGHHDGIVLPPDSETIYTMPSSETIYLAVAYLLPNTMLHKVTPVTDDSISHDAITSHWLGFGLSPQGSMVGADMFIYLPAVSNVDSSNRAEHLLDVHGGANNSYPVVDKFGQDWQLMNTTVIDSPDDNSDNKAWNIVEVKRQLHTNDSNEDLPFIDDSSNLINPTKVIAAWGLLNVMEVGEKGQSKGRFMKETGNSSNIFMRQANTPDGYSELASTHPSVSKAEDSHLESASTYPPPANTEDLYLDLTSTLVPHSPLSKISSTVHFFAPEQETEATADIAVSVGEYKPASANVHSETRWDAETLLGGFKLLSAWVILSLALTMLFIRWRRPHVERTYITNISEIRSGLS